MLALFLCPYAFIQLFCSLFLETSIIHSNVACMCFLLFVTYLCYLIFSLKVLTRDPFVSLMNYLPFLFFNFNWRIVAFQRCISFCCTTYEYIYPLFFGFPSHLGHQRTLSTVLCLYSRFPLVIQFIHRSIYLSIRYTLICQSVYICQ